MFKSIGFWGGFAACAAIIFLTAVNADRTYRGETEIIFLPKNAYIGNSMESVLSNAKQIASSASFYDRLVKENQDMEDPADQLPAYKRKKYWDSTLTIERADNSHVLKIQSISNDREQAELLASYAARDIAAVMSKYYDIRDDLETRVIETTLTYSVSLAYTWKWFLASIAGGFIAAVVIFASAAQIKKDGRVRTKENFLRPVRRAPKPWYPLMDRWVDDSVKYRTKTEMKEPREEVIPPKAADFRSDLLIEGKEAPSVGKKSVAPENLPVGNELVQEKELGEENTEEKPKRIMDHEATPEEVKRRLNKLLRGEM